MRRALAGSIALHGVLGAVLIALAVHPAPAPIPRTAIALEVIDAIEPPHATPAQPDGGGAPSPRPAVAAAGTSGTRARTSRPPVLVAAASRVGRAPRQVAPASVRDYLAGVAVDQDGGAPSERDGASPGGGGLGDGRGRGMGGGGLGMGGGLGGGGGLELPPPPPPPPVSKARPARLIYPSRQRDAGDEEPFLARVIVDDDGYVVGARIVRGTGGPREDQAAQLIWRFRYAPALDDDGRAIRSTVEQSFLVGR